MPEFPARDLAYVMRLDEIGWGCLLLALSIAIHGTGAFLILRMTTAIAERLEQTRKRFRSVRLAIMIFSVWLIVLLHLTEIALWAGFFVWKDAQPNIFSAYY